MIKYKANEAKKDADEKNNSLLNEIIINQLEAISSAIAQRASNGFYEHYYYLSNNSNEQITQMINLLKEAGYNVDFIKGESGNFAWDPLDYGSPDKLIISWK